MLYSPAYSYYISGGGFEAGNMLPNVYLTYLFFSELIFHSLKMP